MYSYHNSGGEANTGDALVVLKWSNLPGAALAGPYTQTSTRPNKLKKDKEVVIAFRYKRLK